MKATKGRLRLNVLPQGWDFVPKTRGDCADGPRPCPWNECRYNLDEWTAGRDATETCALDVADRGAASLDEIGDVLGLSHQMVSKIEQEALERLNKRASKLGIEPPTPRWHETRTDHVQMAYQALEEISRILKERRRKNKQGR